ncbi:hypothetical protein SAMN05216201_10775 [Pseudomonas linyingensis]|uniref:Homeodomain-like domain-containing protein n=1 Tax=Pseudomonas linyingensis TaxID=915471 RepID=A0A1H6XW01_9PSED|nr:hypothetical protein [Pseudomonas linyingensis]SEJ33219.1 hypothetical protein SAMN05216201_10775 [Pseudomonas linyingensis]
MPGAAIAPDVQAQVVALREAGYSLASIATRLDIGISSVQRIIKKRGAVAGAATDEMIARARDEMIAAAYGLESVQKIAASLVHDDLDLAQRTRQKAAAVLDAIEVTADNAMQSARALAAVATALKVTQDVQRRALPLDKLERAASVEELPELTIHIMGPDDVRELREQQRQEAAERINGGRCGLLAMPGENDQEEQHCNDDDVIELTDD